VFVCSSDPCRLRDCSLKYDKNVHFYILRDYSAFLIGNFVIIQDAALVSVHIRIFFLYILIVV